MLANSSLFLVWLDLEFGLSCIRVFLDLFLGKGAERADYNRKKKEAMGVMSRKVLPACGSLCFICPSMRARSRQPVKRYKKLLADIFPRSQVHFGHLCWAPVIAFGYTHCIVRIVYPLSCEGNLVFGFLKFSWHL